MAAATTTTTYKTTADGVYIKNIPVEETAEKEGECMIDIIHTHGERLNGYKGFSYNFEYDSKKDYNFHAWVYDTKTKKNIDTLSNTKTFKTAKYFNDQLGYFGCAGLFTYEEFDSVPTHIQGLIEVVNLIYDLDNTIIRSINHTDRMVCSLHRAIAKQRSNPKRYELKIGSLKVRYKGEICDIINIYKRSDPRWNKLGTIQLRSLDKKKSVV